MKKALAVLLSIICVISVSACSSGSPGNTKDKIADVLALDLSEASFATTNDTHGGFHGDGTSLVQLGFSNDSCEEQIKDNALWKPLPLTENLTALVYGIRSETTAVGPYITFDDVGTPAFPVIENGYYFFLDRHSNSTDAHDDTNVLARPSFNLTIAMYDADTDILYYCEFDT